MRSLLTPRLDIDPAAVAELANEQYLRTRAFWRGQASTPKPDDATLLRQAGTWAQKTAEIAQALAVERDRRARMTEEERRREDLLAYRAKILNPITCPHDLFRALDDGPVNRELARIDAQIADTPAGRAA